MKKLYDLNSVIATLRRGTVKNYWTLEDLDNPPRGYAGKIENYRNLLREQKQPERVEASPSPRDFVPPSETTFDF